MMTTLGADAPVLRLTPGRVAWREVDGRVVALDSVAGVYLGANGTASELWPLLEAGTTHDALARRLAAEHGVPEDRAHADVAAFVASLEARGLLVREDPAA